jgi:hypothetical protein
MQSGNRTRVTAFFSRRRRGVFYLSGALLCVGIALLFIRLRHSFSTREEPEPPERPGEIGTLSLLEEMIDLSGIARLPDPPFVAGLASSTDRRSVSPDDPQGWFANDDWASETSPNYVAVEEGWLRREYVLLDVKGPGAVVRIWSATPTGTLRMYLDESPKPVLEEPLKELLSGEGPIPQPLAHVKARGYNAYFPFPFRKGCKITVDKIVATDPFEGGPLKKFFYQINYRLYSLEAAAKLRTFRRSDFDRADALMRRIARVLDRPSLAYEPSKARSLTTLQKMTGGARAVVERPDGGVIRELSLMVGDASEMALRGTRLRMVFDDELTVETPLGDFFGTGPGLSAYESLPFSVGPGGRLVSRWPMPFRERAAIELLGSADVEGKISVDPGAWTERSLHFHAKWRPTETVRTQPPRDLRLLTIQGTGTYVGNAFNLNNPPGTRWWGEGDEKVYVDGDLFPSLFGTGAEDYYGYAWSTTERFAHAFHAQTRSGSSGFGGRFSMNRFHLLDAVPFSKSFRFDFELWHWDDTQVAWDAVTYYYARPGAKDDARPLTADDLRLR